MPPVKRARSVGTRVGVSVGMISSVGGTVVGSRVAVALASEVGVSTGVVEEAVLDGIGDGSAFVDVAGVRQELGYDESEEHRPTLGELHIPDTESPHPLIHPTDESHLSLLPHTALLYVLLTA